MVRLKYARKGNSGKIEGCTSYNYQYTAAVSETNVERVILTTAQAANFLEGSTIMLGVQSGTDRNTASNYSICDGKKIAKIENVTIDGTDYSAVYIDNGEFVTERELQRSKPLRLRIQNIPLFILIMAALHLTLLQVARTFPQHLIFPDGIMKCWERMVAGLVRPQEKNPG